MSTKNFTKTKSHKEVRKQFLLDDRRIRIRISDKYIRIREAQKHGSYGSGFATLLLSYIGRSVAFLM
jgi:hypothetical protein